MMPWVAPFLYVAVVGGVWFFVPRVRVVFGRDINFFLICAIVVIVFGIAGTLNWRVNWVDYMAWILAIVLAGVSVVKLLKVGALTDGDKGSIDGR